MELRLDYGAIVDVETTGIDPKKDKILEIGIILFRIYGSSQSPQILKMYSGLQDPKEPISEEIQKITGLTNELIAGQTIDWGMVGSMLEEADCLVAHNAVFDRGFLFESGLQRAILEKPWVCTMKHLDWEKRGISTRKLTYIAAELGFLNPFPHRALTDCLTAFKLMGDSWQEMILRSQEREFVVRATGAPYEAKDRLKARGYHWNRNLSVWQKNILESELERERNFLKQDVYAGREHCHDEIHIVA